jgi:hypothetical protein
VGTVARRVERLRLIHFSFGPNQGTWEFWYVLVIDKSFVEFWNIVEHPEHVIPSSWELQVGRDC